MYVSPLLHGVPNQNSVEIATAMSSGAVPHRWAHVYTGDDATARAASHLDPVMPALPVTAHTILAKCLHGFVRWEDHPEAIEWLQHACVNPDAGGVRGAAAMQILEHCSMAEDVVLACKARLEKMAYNCKYHALLRYKQLLGHATHSHVDANVQETVVHASKEALKDTEPRPQCIHQHRHAVHAALVRRRAARTGSDE